MLQSLKTADELAELLASTQIIQSDGERLLSNPQQIRRSTESGLIQGVGQGIGIQRKQFRGGTTQGQRAKVSTVLGAQHFQFDTGCLGIYQGKTLGSSDQEAIRPCRHGNVDFSPIYPTNAEPGLLSREAKAVSLLLQCRQQQLLTTKLCCKRFAIQQASCQHGRHKRLRHQCRTQHFQECAVFGHAQSGTALLFWQGQTNPAIFRHFPPDPGIKSRLLVSQSTYSSQFIRRGESNCALSNHADVFQTLF
ncbi:hypothetical protein FQZ97_740240 [compost metagenome]